MDAAQLSGLSTRRLYGLAMVVGEDPKVLPSSGHCSPTRWSRSAQRWATISARYGGSKNNPLSRPAALLAITPECPLLAQRGHANDPQRCPLLGVKRTSVATSPMSAFDPKRTLAVKICCDAQADHHARMQWHVILGLGATHEAAGIRYTSRWHRGGVAARCPRASSASKFRHRCAPAPTR